MSRSDFARSLRFAALAALSWPALAAALGPVLGVRRALALHVALCAVLYLLRFGRARLEALRAQPARALVVEALLAVAATALARGLYVPTLLGTSLALWGFGLVQSARCLVPAGEAAAPPRDAFEEASRRAQALLEEEA
jgi:hypothetical protein